MIDRYQLRYFLAVVDHGNFSRAAANCHVSQPTLSVGIAKLERDLSASLFVRSSQRVELTPAGSGFLVHARRIEGEFNLALRSVVGVAQGVPTRLGVLRSVPGAVIDSFVRGALAIEPDMRVELVEGSERELAQFLARGRIDCALTLVDRGGDRFLEEPLFEEGYALAVAADHPGAGHAVVAAEALSDNVMIARRHCEALSETSRHFTERGVRPHFAYKSTNDERVLQMVASGLGVTVMPGCYAAPGVARPRLAGFDLRRTIGLAYGAATETLAASPPPLLRAIRALLWPGSPDKAVQRVGTGSGPE